MGDERLDLFPDSPQSISSQPCSEYLVKTPPLPECEVCVIVPVRNEAETLTATLTALAHQIDLAGKPFAATRYEVILLANNCNDDSAAIARHFAQQNKLVLHVVEKTLPPSQAYIGRVRQILMDEAYRRLESLGRKTGIIASTDGDSEVTPTWIAANLHEIAMGADAVGGRIITDRYSRANLAPYAKACHLREVGYRYLIAELETYLDPNPADPFPRHYQHYGASLAVTAQMYKQAGGLPPVRTPEDAAFYQALLRVNARFRHSPLVRVMTSARQHGRADLGLSNQLSQWTAMGEQQQAFLVEPAQAIVTRLRSRYQLRSLWSSMLNGYRCDRQEIEVLAQTLGIQADWLAQELRQSQTFNVLFERIEHQQAGIWAQRWGLVDIKQAIWDLRLYLDSWRRGQRYDRLYGYECERRCTRQYAQSGFADL
ncbi:glycosyltransferase [Aliterella atlantica]|uniref:glycosyltransferase n=1 Tax=Aliterella atlantica TaxID=1827278 RepID=UPI000907EF96|nr:glycosyltransferase [Aliterella atlantica]